MEATNKKKTNPFEEGVTYDVIVKEIGNKSVKEHFKGMLTIDELSWIEEELKNYKLNKKSE